MIMPYLLLAATDPTSFEDADPDPRAQKCTFNRIHTFMLLLYVDYFYLPFFGNHYFFMFNEIGLEFYCVPDIDD